MTAPSNPFLRGSLVTIVAAAGIVGFTALGYTCTPGPDGAHQAHGAHGAHKAHGSLRSNTAQRANVSYRPQSAPVTSVPAPGEPTLAEVRAVTERFRDVNVALAEGYLRDPMNICDTAEMMGKPAKLGGMGIHFFRPDLLGITAPPNPRVSGNGIHTDFRKPSILIYEPQQDGSLQLVAVENLTFAKAWKEAGNDAPPSFHGVAYDSMVDDPTTPIDEAHMFEPHYDRHVWIYRENPNGVFAQFNPAVTCKHHRDNSGHKHHASR